MSGALGSAAPQAPTKQDLELLEAETQALRTQLRHTQLERDSLTEERDRLQAQWHQLQDEVEELERRNTELHGKLDAEELGHQRTMRALAATQEALAASTAEPETVPDTSDSKPKKSSRKVSLHVFTPP